MKTKRRSLSKGSFYDDTNHDGPKNTESIIVIKTKKRKNYHPSSPLLSSSSSSASTTATENIASFVSSNNRTNSKKRNRSTIKVKDTIPTSTSSRSAGGTGALQQQQHHHHHHKKTIRITQEDHDSILQLLQSIDWSMAKNTSRKNVIRENDPNTPHLNNDSKNGKPYCQSFIFGKNMKDPNYEYSYWTQQYPMIYQKLQTYFDNYNTTNFTYTHITINKNLQCKRHTDGGNMGLSYIIAIGNYSGGELCIEEEEEEEVSSKQQRSAAKIKKDKVYNLHRTFVLFNGKEQPHETLSFIGERYTLVYYTSDIIPRSSNTGLILPGGTSNSYDTNSRPNLTTTTTMGGLLPTSTLQNNTVTPMTHTASSILTAKFNAMKKKLGRKR